ncbi:MAG: hypothetical protein DKINENOH_04870 [bacterium]|nr:hypothetical protein [bacterium]
MRRPKSAVGVSMLDLISNALAATLILFFVLSILKQPPIPPEYVLGTLVVRCSLRPIGSPKFNSGDTAKVEVWLHSQELNTGRKFGEVGIASLEDIAGMNIRAFLDSLTIADLPALAALYTASPNEKIIIMRYPPKGNWFAGLLYVSHDKLEFNQQKAIGHIEVWFVKPKPEQSERDIDILAKDSRLIAPTESFGIAFEIPDWSGKSP